jgi:hypothetical protein
MKDGEGHPLLGRRMPDLDLVTVSNKRRAAAAPALTPGSRTPEPSLPLPRGSVSRPAALGARCRGLSLWW